MTWGLNTRTSATWRGGRKCSHFAAARALQLLPRFQMPLVWVANFYLFAQDPWRYANVREHRTSSFLKVSRMFFKKHCFVVSKEPGSLLRPSLFCNSPCSSLLIGWYAMRCTFEAMGNPEEFFFFTKKQQAIDDDRWYRTQIWVLEMCPPWLQPSEFSHKSKLWKVNKRSSS